MRNTRESYRGWNSRQHNATRRALPQDGPKLHEERCPPDSSLLVIPLHLARSPFARSPIAFSLAPFSHLARSPRHKPPACSLFARSSLARSIARPPARASIAPLLACHSPWLARSIACPLVRSSLARTPAPSLLPRSPLACLSRYNTNTYMIIKAYITIQISGTNKIEL